jgi:hypothetical protein
VARAPGEKLDCNVAGRMARQDFHERSAGWDLCATHLLLGRS